MLDETPKKVFWADLVVTPVTVKVEDGRLWLFDLVISTTQTTVQVRRVELWKEFVKGVRTGRSWRTSDEQLKFL